MQPDAPSLSELLWLAADLLTVWAAWHFGNSRGYREGLQDADRIRRDAQNWGKETND